MKIVSVNVGGLPREVVWKGITVPDGHHPPVAAVRELVERHVGPITEDAPLICQKARRCNLLIIDSNAPPSTRLLNPVGPPRKPFGLERL
jgi:hypothetical protein